MKKGGGMFKVGGKVVRVGNVLLDFMLPVQTTKIGHTYTIKDFIIAEGHLFLLLEETGKIHLAVNYKPMSDAFGSETAEMIEQEINESILIEK